MQTPSIEQSNVDTTELLAIPAQGPTLDQLVTDHLMRQEEEQAAAKRLEEQERAAAAEVAIQDLARALLAELGLSLYDACGFTFSYEPIDQHYPSYGDHAVARLELDGIELQISEQPGSSGIAHWVIFVPYSGRDQANRGQLADGIIANLAYHRRRKAEVAERELQRQQAAARPKGPKSSSDPHVGLFRAIGSALQANRCDIRLLHDANVLADVTIADYDEHGILVTFASGSQAVYPWRVVFAVFPHAPRQSAQDQQPAPDPDPADIPF